MGEKAFLEDEESRGAPVTFCDCCHASLSCESEVDPTKLKPCPGAKKWFGAQRVQHARSSRIQQLSFSFLASCSGATQALSIFWTSGKKVGVVDTSQQVDRMANTRVECPCLTPNGQHFSLEEARPLTGQAYLKKNGFKESEVFMNLAQEWKNLSFKATQYTDASWSTWRTRWGSVCCLAFYPVFFCLQELASLAGNAGRWVIILQLLSLFVRKSRNEGDWKNNMLVEDWFAWMMVMRVMMEGKKKIMMTWNSHHDFRHPYHHQHYHHHENHQFNQEHILIQ